MPYDRWYNVLLIKSSFFVLEIEPENDSFVHLLRHRSCKLKIFVPFYSCTNILCDINSSAVRSK